MLPTNPKKRRRLLTNPPEITPFALTLEREPSRSCQVTSICGFKDGFYIYTITFSGTRSGWRGRMHVPESKVEESTRLAWNRHFFSQPVGPGPEGMPIEQSDATEGEATFLDLKKEYLSKNGRGIYVREMEVEVEGGRFGGEVHVLKLDPVIVAAVQLARERAGAVQSVERVDVEEEEREVFTVGFWGALALKKGRRADVEVWQRDGQDVLFEGRARVVSLEEDERGQKRLVVEIQVSGNRHFLQGTLNERMRHGRFTVVKDPGL